MRMNTIGYLSLAALLCVAACGGDGSGGSSSSGSASTAGTQTTSQQPTATGSVTMSIPLKNGDGNTVRTPTALGSQSGTTLKPTFVDGGSNGYVKVFFDGVQVAAFPTANLPSGPGPSGSANLANGGSFSYQSTISYVRNQPVATIAATYATVPGTHKIGAVQVNGPCASSDPCIPNNEGYVLAQGETAALLQPGQNADVSLYLRGVMQSAYICDYPACNGSGLTVDQDGYYHLYVVVADENGTAITHQVDASGSTIPFDNSYYAIVETGNSLLDIRTEAGKPIGGQSLYTPGSDRQSDNGGSYGVAIKVKCNAAGTTTLIAQLGPDGGKSIAPIAGFAATSGTNYPTANIALGSVGADQYFGNQLSLSCNGTGALTVQ